MGEKRLINGRTVLSIIFRRLSRRLLVSPGLSSMR